jgi:hypothetical protein
MLPAAAPTDDASDYYRAFLAEPYPCADCRLAGRCKASLEACAAFSLYVAHAGEARWRAAPRMPTRALFETIFTPVRLKGSRGAKRPRLLTAEERRRRNTARKQRWRQDQQKQQRARDAA